VFHIHARLRLHRLEHGVSRRNFRPQRLNTALDVLARACRARRHLSTIDAPETIATNARSGDVWGR
jgi:hypothetical protein